MCQRAKNIALLLLNALCRWARITPHATWRLSSHGSRPSTSSSLCLAFDVFVSVPNSGAAHMAEEAATPSIYRAATPSIYRSRKLCLIFYFDVSHRNFFTKATARRRLACH